MSLRVQLQIGTLPGPCLNPLGGGCGGNSQHFLENAPKSLRTYATLHALVALQRKVAVRLLNVWMHLCTFLIDHVR